MLICGIVVLPQLCQFWNSIQSKLADVSPYTGSIGDMRIKVSDLQDVDKEVMKLRLEGLSEGWEDIEQVLHY